MSTEQNNQQALRYNQGKLKWSLVDWKSLEGLVRVLEMGSKKYGLTKKLDILSLFQLCQKSQFVISVKIVDTLSHEDFVQPVIDNQPYSMVHVKDVPNIAQLIKDLSVEPVLSTSEHTLLVRKEKKLKNTKTSIENNQNLKKESELERLNEETTPHIEKKLNETSSYEDWLTMELLKSFIDKNVLKDVKFAEIQQDYMLTMIIQLEDTEVFCVASATTPLDCLTMILNYLKKELIILNNFKIENNFLHISGKYNWTKGMPVTEVSESLLRHMFAFLEGEDRDNESLELHLSHVLCNAMFLIHIMREKPEFDDRTIINKQNDNG